MKTCYLFLANRLNKERLTATIGEFDKTPHTLAAAEVRQHFENEGYIVTTELWKAAIFSEFELAHFFDVVAIKDGVYKIIEVKPLDKPYYNTQYMFAQLLANAIFPSFQYYVFEYETGEYIPKQPPDYDEALNIIQNKLENAMVELPIAIPSKACEWCPYATCKEHPQHDCTVMVGPFGEEVCPCAAN